MICSFRATMILEDTGENTGEKYWTPNKLTEENLTSAGIYKQENIGCPEDRAKRPNTLLCITTDFTHGAREFFW